MKTLGTSDKNNIVRSTMNNALVRRAMLVITVVCCALPVLAGSKKHSTGVHVVISGRPQPGDAQPGDVQPGDAQIDKTSAIASAIWGTKTDAAGAEAIAVCGAV